MLEHAQLAGMKLPANCSRLRQVTATKAQPRTTSLGSRKAKLFETIQNLKYSRIHRNESICAGEAHLHQKASRWKGMKIVKIANSKYLINFIRYFQLKIAERYLVLLG